MVTIKLLPHDQKYANRLYQLSSDPNVNEHLSFKDGSVEDTKWFINHIINEERDGRSISRVILNEENHIIGVTTLMDIDKEKCHCSIGSWIGKAFWGKGYNQKSKEEILKIAFGQLGVDLVFAGAHAANVRSQKAQEKLPYVTLHVETMYPEEHRKLEEKEKQPCILNCITKNDFFQYLEIKHQPKLS
ncbi:GNAT family N-acetyltransferase [Lysinibacillus antri]|uniref:N-acetyltransferase n=1 Tax=Lysinibacillus antri TaxID=2498145 RepID=A0A432LBS9_9BACI|nr:GNAT family N-acetyltransferase [Lysinibacillus antri]RUL52131.1 N-acetyltransferase [Lysinibacillus antri]